MQAIVRYQMERDIYITTIVNTFYGGIIWVWVCQMGEKVGAMTTGEK